jgi:hypothetical protein
VLVVFSTHFCLCGRKEDGGSEKLTPVTLPAGTLCSKVKCLRTIEHALYKIARFYGAGVQLSKTKTMQSV